MSQAIKRPVASSECRILTSLRSEMTNERSFLPGVREDQPDCDREDRNTVLFFYQNQARR